MMFVFLLLEKSIQELCQSIARSEEDRDQLGPAP